MAVKTKSFLTYMRAFVTREVIFVIHQLRINKRSLAIEGFDFFMKFYKRSKTKILNFSRRFSMEVLALNPLTRSN